MKRSAMTILVLIILGGISTRSLFPQAPKPAHTVATRADVDRWVKELSNWGRWGKDDQMATLNLITPAKRRDAAKLVKEGVTVSLEKTPMLDKAVDDPTPFVVTRSCGGGCVDSISVAYHGNAHTHLDGLDHIFAVDGKTYNGYAVDKAVGESPEGHPRNNIANFKNGIVTRGILIDIPRLKGVPYLEPGTPIYSEDIEAFEKMAGIKVSSGDALFIRTGRWARRAAVGPWDVFNLRAGLDISVEPWLRQRDIAVLGSDVAQSVRPKIPNLGPVGDAHDFTIAVLGVPLLDNCDLEALSEATAARHRWEFLLVAGPLAIPGGTGSPINPIAIF